jgi:DNA (cytosine-5)-methyltransferase 1
MYVGGLFSGIGGFELAFQQAGFQTKLLVELDPDAKLVLTEQFPDVEIQTDVTELTSLPSDISVLTAGFPCQNLSMAGDKSGINGAKSVVVKKMLELIKYSRTPTIVIENVYFMLQLDSGKGMKWLVDQFETMGYHWAYRVLDTMGFGLPHRRRRLYFIATLQTDPRTILFSDNSPTPALDSKPELSVPLGFYWTEGRSGIGFAIDGIPPLKSGSGLGIPSPPAVLFCDGDILLPSLQACERLQGFNAGWTAICDGKSSKHPGWRMLGNAVSVPVARWVANRIRKPGPVVEFECRPLLEGQRWPAAAWNVGYGRVAVAATDKPIHVPRASILDFRDEGWTNLSHRALGGFIRRVKEGRLRTPEGFMPALQYANAKAAARADGARSVSSDPRSASRAAR